MTKKYIATILIIIPVALLGAGAGVYFFWQNNNQDQKSTQATTTDQPAEQNNKQADQSAILNTSDSNIATDTSTNTTSYSDTNSSNTNNTSTQDTTAVDTSNLDQGILEGEVRKNLDLYYTTVNGKKIYLDLYRPVDISQKLPLVIWIHGGGWQAGDKANGQGKEIASYGFAVASINYRLSDEATFPAQIQDVKAAVRWLRVYADKYGLDKNNFGAWGDSAGGHLAALLGTSGGVAEFEQGDNLNYSSQVQAVCDWYGPTDFSQVDYSQYENYANSVEALVGETDAADLMQKANPIKYVDNNDPPFLIMHGDQDSIVPISQSDILYQALNTAGVKAEFTKIPGAGHGDGFEFGEHVLGKVVPFFEQNLRD